MKALLASDSVILQMYYDISLLNLTTSYPKFPQHIPYADLIGLASCCHSCAR